MDESHVLRLKDQVERSVAAGARVEVGGRFDAETRYVAPTIVSGVTTDAPLMQGEIFGPVLPVLAYRELDEVVAFVRRCGKPLAMYIFTRDDRVTRELLARTSAGSTAINTTLLQYANPGLPFGGVGASGLGAYHGFHGFRAFSHARSLLRQREPALVRLFFPPYRGRLHELARRVLRLLE